MNREQCRAARALLGWSQSRLAQECGFSENVVTSFESAHREPHVSSLRSIRAALVYAGVIFVDEADGFGVKLRASPLIDARPPNILDTETPVVAAQARAARAALSVSQPQAAKALGVGLSLLVAFETEARLPHARNLQKIRAGYEALGVRFFRDGDRAALSLNTSTIRAAIDPPAAT